MPDKEAAATPVAKQEVKFKQPDSKKHVYHSTEPEGYDVTINADKKSWTAQNGETVLGAEFPNRASAMEACGSDAFGTHPKGAKVAKVASLSGREASVLRILKDDGSNVSIADIAKQGQFEMAQVMGIVSTLARRKMVVLEGMGAKIVDIGISAIEAYVPGAAKPRTGTVADPEARAKFLEAKYGARPAHIGPRPTDLELAEGRMANAHASLAWALLDQRVHPYSPIAQKKVDSAKERVDLAEKALAEAQKSAG